MSKVYSFRLSDDNPREAQAREVINAWVVEGYSLRYIISEALNSLSKKNERVEDLERIMGFLENITSQIEVKSRNPSDDPNNANLSSSFVGAVKNSAKSGLRSS